MPDTNAPKPPSRQPDNATAFAIFTLIVVLTILFFTAPHRPMTPGEKIGAAVDDISQGADKASRDLKNNNVPGR